MEGLMRGLKLSEAELEGVKLGGQGKEVAVQAEAQAIGKLMSEKQAHAGAVENALGPIWCPMKGIDCKDLGENVFLFTFKQPGGKRKAVENGPWMFDDELMVVEEFDPAKNVEEYSFSHIPIWVRVYRLPLGKMNLETGMLIGNIVGEYIEMDGLEKDKGCSIRLKKGEEPQYGKWLKWVPPKKTNPFGAQRSWSDPRGRRNYMQGSSESKHGSDAPSWRNEARGSLKAGKGAEGTEKEVIRPLKLTIQGREGDKKDAQMDSGGKSASKTVSSENDGVEGQKEEEKIGGNKGKGEMVVDSTQVQQYTKDGDQVHAARQLGHGGEWKRLVKWDVGEQLRTEVLLKESSVVNLHKRMKSWEGKEDEGRGREGQMR
ncbi:hypothetical protein ACQ4PT_025157 [Festuca glaucescens]